MVGWRGHTVLYCSMLGPRGTQYCSMLSITRHTVLAFADALHSCFAKLRVDGKIEAMDNPKRPLMYAQQPYNAATVQYSNRTVQ